jgi:hypothetical protein
LWYTLLLSALAWSTFQACGADTCPTADEEIGTDRPDITNSSLVVPIGSRQAAVSIGPFGMDRTLRIVQIQLCVSVLLIALSC